MTSFDDLKAMTGESDWFATIAVPAPSNLDDAQPRFELEWRNARRELSESRDDGELDRLDKLVDGLRLSVGASGLVVHARHGSTLIEALDDTVSASTVEEEVVRLLSTKVASQVTAAAGALGEGIVAKLPVHDDGTPGDQADPTWCDGARLGDRAIVAALATDAEVLVVPQLAMTHGALAATMRW